MTFNDLIKVEQKMFFNYWHKTPKTIVNDNTIKNLSVNDIDKLKQSPNNEFNFTKNAMHDAYEENDIDKIKYLHKTFALELPGNGVYHVDVAIQNGQTEMAKFLVNDFKCQPSLYAKQMAIIGGHTELVKWLNNFSVQRNDISIGIVHHNYSGQDKKRIWADCIPEQFRDAELHV